MARTGESIENTVTGERIVWVQTAADTAGESLCFDLYLIAGAAVSAEHRHLRQTEHFVVLGGSLRVTVNGRQDDLGAGDETTIEAGTPHRWVNVSNAETQVRVTLSPALDTETFFETLFGLARDGKANRKGLPGLAQIALAYRTLGDSCPRVTRPPVGVQDAVFAVAAPVGRMLGKRGVYARYSPDHPKA
jgi:quercetin dioxygenase-like cupin family protein